MRIHCLQHASFEGLGAIKAWIDQHQFTLSYTRFFESIDLPSPKDIDWVIVMGGPMSVNDEEEFPWLVQEKQFIRECISSGKIVIGICLGSQLIANALGSKIFKNQEKEIGWFPITFHPAKNAHKALSVFTDQQMVFHWHGETFDLPKDATLISSSEGCKNQIFTIEKNVFGFQCHFEMNRTALVGMLNFCRSELIPDTYIQSEEKIIQLEKEHSVKMNEVFFRFLDELLLPTAK